MFTAKRVAIFISSPLRGEVPTLVGGGGELGLLIITPIDLCVHDMAAKPTFPLKGKGIIGV